MFDGSTFDGLPSIPSKKPIVPPSLLKGWIVACHVSAESCKRSAVPLNRPRQGTLARAMFSLRFSWFVWTSG